MIMSLRRAFYEAEEHRIISSSNMDQADLMANFSDSKLGRSE